MITRVINHDTIMSALESIRTVDRVGPNTKRRDLVSIQKDQSELKTFLLEREFSEDEIDGYLENLTVKQWRRLVTLLRGDTAMTFTFDEAFQDFAIHCPAWSAVENRILLFDTYPHHTYMRVLRAQTTSRCSAHAYVVLIHLEQCIRAGPDSEVLMPDLSALLSRIYSREEYQRKLVCDYVNGNVKFSAVNFLQSVYNMNSYQMDTIKLNVPTSEEMAARLLADNLRLRTKLALHPALLSLEIGADLAIEGLFSYDGMPSCEVERDQGREPHHHAMVIVGLRNEGNKYYYMCMNSWKRKLFVELSDVYLARCNAEITILHRDTPLEALAKFGSVPRFPGLSAETAVAIDTDSDEHEQEDEDGEREDYVIYDVSH
jgi:hypothetical protein